MIIADTTDEMVEITSKLLKGGITFRAWLYNGLWRIELEGY